MIRQAVPDLCRPFESVEPGRGPWEQEPALREIYAQLPAVNFSSRVLAAYPAGLAVLPVTGVEWSDWGTPSRVLATLRRLGRPVATRARAVLSA